MPKLSDLTSAIGDLNIPGLTAQRVGQTARRLRDEGAIKKGSRGRYGGQEMDTSDAAALLIGLIGGEERPDMMRAAETVELVGPLTMRQYRRWNTHETLDTAELQAILGIGPEATFQEAIAAVLTVVNGVLPEPYWALSSVFISVSRPEPVGTISFAVADGRHEIVFRHPQSAVRPPPGSPLEAHAQRNRELNEFWGGDSYAYSVKREIGPKVISSLASVFGGEK